MKITKRDVAFFVLGVFTFLAIDMALDWDDNVKAFNQGYENAQKGKEYDPS